MTLVLYGIPNCDTVKKARVWLDAHGIAHTFHDFRKQGVDAAMLQRWCDALGWEVVLNRAGTTFRALPEADRQGLNAARAIALMLAQPAMIKRPVAEAPGVLQAGFRPELFEKLFA